MRACFSVLNTLSYSVFSTGYPYTGYPLNLHCKTSKHLYSLSLTYKHTNSKGFLRVDGMRKKLCDEMVCFCLMHMQRSLLCPF